MIYIDLPTIGQGTTEQQLAEIRSYIYKSNEQMNATLANLTVDKIWEQTASALSASSNSKSETDKLVSQYQKIRDLIIKTADTIIQTDEQMKMTMNGSYLAKSQFGKYLLNTSVELEGKSTGFTQLYTYASELGSDYDKYKIYQQNFIKQGLLDDSKDIPIYGIDVGLLTSEFEVDGEKVEVNSNKKLRITPDKLSLFEGNCEVAYIREEQIYFPKAVINGGSININDKFTVSSEGVLNAKEGNYSGDISADSITTSLNKWSNHIKLSNGYIDTYYDGEITSRIGGQGQTFYNDSGVEIGKFSITRYNGKLGLGTILKHGTGTFITLAGHYSSGTDTNYIADVVWSRGNTSEIQNNIYPEMGLHINTPCYFHNCDCNFRGSNVSRMNITEITSSGKTTKTETLEVMCRDSSGNQYWQTLTITNGLITEKS